MKKDVLKAGKRLNGMSETEISNWTKGDQMIPLSEEVYNEILSRYYKFVSHLQEFLFDLAQQNTGTAETAK